MKQEKLKNKEVKSSHDLLTPEMADAIDMLCYLFLKEKGFNTENCDKKNSEGEAARKRVAKELKTKGLKLIWHMPTIENKIFCYFTLEKDGKKMATSRTIEFVCQTIEMNPNKEDSGTSE